MDGLKPSVAYGPTTPEQVNEALVGRFLRDAPLLEGADDLGAATCTITPQPHQIRVVRDVVARFPGSCMLADEVGLGKTVEAGLALRQLWITGRVRRALVLVPRAVLRQWQEELWEKFALDVPRYDGSRVVGRDGEPVAYAGSPWDAFGILLASSHLARRADRRAEILGAAPWDLVIVDEAHHARRRGARMDRREPNLLLALLGGSGQTPGLKDRTRSLWLLTATPMQVHPVEVWDLLRLLGMGGLWGASAESFVEYHRQLMLPPSQRRWDFLARMLRDHVARVEDYDPRLVTHAKSVLGEERWLRLRRDIEIDPASLTPATLGVDGMKTLDELLHRHTPVRALVYRNTRELLRRYHARGLTTDPVPSRRPENLWVELSPPERALYDAVEDYIAESYAKSEAKNEERKRGLGFVMAVYRRRLTSSFAALQKSLERRLAWIRDEAAAWVDPDEDIGAEAETDADDDEGDPRARLAAHRAEARRIEDFLRRLALLQGDSKYEHFVATLQGVFRTETAVLVFTQYTDTLDWIRAQLVTLWGPQVATYTGRGGERWDGERWAPVAKEALKDMFRRHEVSLLLCTESASEGLNLQTCRVLVNYDMPWNPMRVEQRIGRIDRIGQRAREVLVYNYFYRDTVEATIYARLGERIGWFTSVVGTLQPILQASGRAIERLAMVDRKRRVSDLEDAFADMRAQEELSKLPLFRDDDEDFDASLRAPATLDALERTLPRLPSLRDLFAPVRESPRVWEVTLDGRARRVTFDRQVFDQYPDSVQLLTWGTALFERLLDVLPAPVALTEGGVVRITSRAQPPLVTWFDVGSRVIRHLGDLASLRVLLTASNRKVSPPRGMEDSLRARVERLQQREQRALQARARAERDALLTQFEDALIRAGLCEVRLSELEGLLRRRGTVGFGDAVMDSLARRGAPWKAMLAQIRKSNRPAPRAEPTHPAWETLRTMHAHGLEAELKDLATEATELLHLWGRIDASALSSTPPEAPLVVECFEIRPSARAVPARDTSEAPPSQVPPPRPVAPPDPPSPPDPTPPPAVKRSRGLATDQGREKLARQLEGQLARWFEREPTMAAKPADAPNAKPLTVPPWVAFEERATGETALVLVSPAQPALADELPPHRRALALAEMDDVEPVLVANLARVGTRREVSPRAETYRWIIPGRASDARDVLDGLSVDGFAADVATTFRLDVEGPTQRLAARVLRPGARYALVVPPSLGGAPLPGEPAREWGGWRACVLDLPAAVPPSIREALAGLGLALDQESLTLALGVVPPDEWRVTPAGEPFACFSPRRAPVIELAASRAFDAGAVVVLVSGPAGTARHELPAGARWTFALDALEPGHYAVRALTDDTTVEMATLYLAVDPAALGRWARAAPRVRVGDRDLAAGNTHECDLRAGDGGSPFELCAPPCAPWRLRWTGAERWQAPWSALDGDGTARSPRWMEAVREAATRSPRGALEIDLGVEGVVRVEHEWRLDALTRVSLAEGLRAKVAEREAALAMRASSTALFRQMWLGPLVALLGWRLGEDEHSLPGATALSLGRLACAGDGFAWAVSALLVWLDAPLDRARWASEIYPSLAALVANAPCERVMMTDGVRWWRVEPGKRGFPPAGVSLDEATEADGAEDFLYHYGAWG